MVVTKHGAAAMSGDSEDFNKPYLPERYRQKVMLNRRRRLVRRAILGVIFIAVIAAAALFFGVPFPGWLHVPALSSQQPVPVPAHSAATTSPGLNVTATPTPGFVVGPGVPLQASAGNISLANAVVALRRSYPAQEFAILSVNISTMSGHTLFGFVIHPAGGTSGDESTAFIDAASGESWTPGQDTSPVSAGQAEFIAGSVFPSLNPDRVDVRYGDDPERGKIWVFTLYAGTAQLLNGTIDATSGEIATFSLTVPATGRPATPVLSVQQAQNIADRYITDHTIGAHPVNMTVSRYEPWGTPAGPVAGEYRFTYRRIYSGYPTDEDWFKVAVDAVTGQVIGYCQLWTTQDYSFAETMGPSLTSYDAGTAVIRAAGKVYPASADSISIISEEILWQNRHPPGIVQRPGSIPLRWKVVFDDDIIRANSSLPAATGWVDIRTGNVTELDYRH
jgi:hypothetical protein